MKVSELKVGDRVTIVDVPGKGIIGYELDPETEEVYEILVSRKRSVRISEVNESGTWYECRIRKNNGWERHFLNIVDSDNNWVPVKKRK